MNRKCCLKADLSAYLDGELSRKRHAQVEAHLRTCDTCADMLATLEKNRQRVASIAQPVPIGFKEGVMAKIHAQFQDELSAYLDDELVPARREQVSAHLDTCEECSAVLARFKQNRERIKSLEQPVPTDFARDVMAKVRQQAQAAQPIPTRRNWLRTLSGWIPDVGRWFLRPVTAGATGVLTLALILGAVYLYPTGSAYEETLDFYFGVHAEQLTDSTVELGVEGTAETTGTETAAPTETSDDTELFFDLYMEDVGN